MTGGRRPGIQRSSITAAAPAACACTANVWASKRSPRKATKRLSGATARESVHTALTRSLPRPVKLAADNHCRALRSSNMTHPVEPGERLSRLLHIAEGQARTGKLLPGLVTLAGDQHDVA